MYAGVWSCSHDTSCVDLCINDNSPFVAWALGSKYEQNVGFVFYSFTQLTYVTSFEVLQNVHDWSI